MYTDKDWCYLRIQTKRSPLSQDLPLFVAANWTNLSSAFPEQICELFRFWTDIIKPDRVSSRRGCCGIRLVTCTGWPKRLSDCYSVLHLLYSERGCKWSVRVGYSGFWSKTCSGCRCKKLGAHYEWQGNQHCQRHIWGIMLQQNKKRTTF